MSIRNTSVYRFDQAARCLALITILLVSFTGTALSQDRADLERKREKLLEEIRYTEKLLGTTSANVKSTMSDLSALKRKIDLRESLVRNLNAEVNAISREVKNNEETIVVLNDQMEKLKKRYSESIYNAYKYQKTHQQLLFVLAAENFNQAVRRLNYLRKLNGKRREQADEIKASELTLQRKIAELEAQKAEKTVLLAENKVQMKSLEDEKRTKDRYVADLKKDERKYRAEITRKDGEAKKLDKQIRDIIQKEIAAREKKEEEFGKTPEYIQLSKEFSSNRGKLPWPVEQGYISRYFGKQKHPELNIDVDNNGIDIRTGKGEPVRAIFNGEVVSVISNPVFKNGVIIKHGEYFTVYTKLGTVSVKRGDKVNTRDIIGTAFTEGGTSEVHLEIWQGKTNMDPYAWIYKK